MCRGPVGHKLEYSHIGFILKPLTLGRQGFQKQGPIEPGDLCRLAGRGNPIDQLGGQITVSDHLGHDGLLTLNGANEFVQIDTLTLQKRGNRGDGIEQCQQKIFGSNHRTAPAPNIFSGHQQRGLTLRRQTSLPIFHRGISFLGLRASS